MYFERLGASEKRWISAHLEQMPTGRSRKVKRYSSFYFLLPGPPYSFYFLISFYFLLTRPSVFWQGSGSPRSFIFTSKYAYPIVSNNLSTFYFLSTFYCQDHRFRWRPEGINGFFFLFFNLCNDLDISTLNTKVRSGFIFPKICL